MSESKEIPLFYEVQPLFPEQRDLSLVDFFLREIQGKDRSGNRRSTKVKVEYGKDVYGQRIELLPSGDGRVLDASELTQLIVDFYNRDYWLIDFWRALATNAAGSAVAREIVRAIVKHSIYLTGEELLAHHRSPVDLRLVRQERLMDRVSYYKGLFDWSSIYQCLREPERSTLRDRLKRSRVGDVAHRIANLPFSTLQSSLDEVNAILGSSDLPYLVETAQEQRENLATILRTVYLNAVFWRDSRKIRRSLRQLVG